MGEELLDIIKSVCQSYLQEGSQCMIGEVISAGDDLKIHPNGTDSDFILTSQFLILGALCKEFWVPYEDHFEEEVHQHYYTDDGSRLQTEGEKSKIKKVLIWRGLKKGDKVIMFRLSASRTYYVMQRVEGVEDGD